MAFHRVRQHFQARSATMLLSIENRIDRMMQLWLLLAGLACVARLYTAPFRMGGADVGTILPYLLLLIGPFASTVLALRWFAEGDRQPQPQLRIARAGRWTSVSREEAMRLPLYGSSGIMVSLVLGMLFNVPARAGEFLASMPPVPHFAPAWFSNLHTAMTFDVVLFSSLYMIAFVAALRRAPIFPRLLATIWILDLTAQVTISRILANFDGLPGEVGSALNVVLDGNIKKVLISVALWLPYLLFSKRVNLTYRHRIPA